MTDFCPGIYQSFDSAVNTRPGDPFRKRPRDPFGRRRLLAAASLLIFPLILCIVPGPAGAATVDEDIEELVALLRLDEDTRNQYQQCLNGSADLSVTAIRREILDTYTDIDLDSEDIAILVSIYTEFYNQGCDYLAGSAMTNFYRAEIRKRFTRDEIESLIEFYKTPLGLKLNAEWLGINQAYGEILNRRQASDGLEAQQRFEERMQEFWRYLDEKATEETSEQGA